MQRLGLSLILILIFLVFSILVNSYKKRNVSWPLPRIRCCNDAVPLRQGATSRSSYQHDGDRERFHICQARRKDRTQQHIAKAQGPHPLTVCHELKRKMYAPWHIYSYDGALQILQTWQLCAIDKNLTN